MPVHNWNRVEPNLYHHFHQMWTMHICDALNGWDEIDDEEPFELPSDQPLTLAAYVAGDALAEIPPKAYVHPVGVGETMLDMPAYLDFDNYVPVPLEETYMATWAKCPADFRSVVETGRLPGE